MIDRPRIEVFRALVRPQRAAAAGRTVGGMTHEETTGPMDDIPEIGGRFNDLAISDFGYVPSKGRVVASGTPHQLTKATEVH